MSKAELELLLASLDPNAEEDETPPPLPDLLSLPVQGGPTIIGPGEFNLLDGILDDASRVGSLNSGDTATSISFNRDQISNKTTAKQIDYALDNSEWMNEKAELLKKVRKQDDKIQEFTESLDIINAEIEDLTVENMDLREKFDSLSKGGIGVITRYHREILKISQQFEENVLKIQKQWINYSKLQGDLESFKDWLGFVRDNLEASKTYSKLMIPSEILITTESLRFVEISKAKEVGLSAAVGLMMTGIDKITQKNHMYLNLSEFECKIEPILLNLQRSLNAFRQSAITDSDDPLGEDDNQLIRSVSGSKKVPTEKKLDLVSLQQEIAANVKAEDQVIDSLLDEGLEGADMATKLKQCLSESQTLNDKLKHRIQELKAGNEAYKEQVRSDFDSRLAVSLERQNHVLLEKDTLIGSLKSQNETLVSEVGRLRAQIVELGNEIDQMTRSGRPGGTDPSGVVVSISTGIHVVRPGELPPSVLDEEAEALLKRINRYRNERTEAEKRSRELRAQLNLCEEKLAVEIDKNRLLRPMIEDLEHENRELQDKLASGWGSRTSQGAACIPKVLRGGAKSNLERPPKTTVNPTSLYEDEEDMEDQDAYYDYYDSQGDLPEEPGDDHHPNSGREVTPEKYAAYDCRLAKKKVKGFELDEIKEGASHRLQELSARSRHQSDKKSNLFNSGAKVTAGVKSLFKSVKGMFN